MENFDIQSLSQRAMASDAHFFDEIASPAAIRQYLASTKSADKVVGMKFLLAGLSKGRESSHFFPDVVKNVAVKNLEVKKMVYIYLVHYADYNDQCRELALLSINSFQQDMGGSNQLLRALALRVLTSIRVSDIVAIQLLAARKCSLDPSAYVRKCAATALAKLFTMHYRSRRGENDSEEDCDEEIMVQLQEILKTLLNDAVPLVLGSAMQAFSAICPDSFELIHRHFRKLCHLLADMNEWTQVAVLETLTRYTRSQFVNPNNSKISLKKSIVEEQQQGHGIRVDNARSSFSGQGFYSDDEDENSSDVGKKGKDVWTVSKGSAVESHNPRQESIIGATVSDSDYQLVLKSSLPLLRSCNASVVLGVCALHFYCNYNCSNGDLKVLELLARALVRVLRGRREMEYFLLLNIRQMATAIPSMFAPHLRDFFISPDGRDPSFVKLLKLDIMGIIVSSRTVPLVLRELQVYVRHSNKAFACAAVKTLEKVLALSNRDQAPLQGPSGPSHADMATSSMEGLVHLIAKHIFATKCAGDKQGSPGRKTCSVGSDSAANVINSSVVIIRKLLQQHRSLPVSIKVLNWLVQQLMASIDGGPAHGIGLEHVEARSNIVWLIAEFRELLGRRLTPDLLRMLTRSFVEEAPEVRIQIMNTAIKLNLSLKHATAISAEWRLNDTLTLTEPERGRSVAVVQALTMYVLEMARYDTDTDCRDRARFLTAMLGMTSTDDNEGDRENTVELLDTGGGASADEAKKKSAKKNDTSSNEKCLFALSELSSSILLPDDKPLTASLSGRSSAPASTSQFFMGTLSNTIGHAVRDHRPLPKWSSTSSKSSIRDSPESMAKNNSIASVATGSTAATRTPGSHRATKDQRFAKHNDFYADDDSDVDVPNQNLAPQRPNARYTGDDSDSDSSSASSYSSTSSSSSSRSTSSSSSSSSSYSRTSSSSSSDSESDDETEYVAGKQSLNNVSGSGSVGSASLVDLQSSNRANNLGHLIGSTSSVQPTQVVAASSLTREQVFDQLMESFTAPATSPVKLTGHRGSTAAALSTTPASQAPLIDEGLPPPILSDKRLLLRPEVASGLSVAIAIRRGVDTSGKYLKSVVVVENSRKKGEYPIRRVRIAFAKEASSGSGVVASSAIEDIPILQPQESVEVPFEMNISNCIGKTARVDIRSDIGSTTANFIGELRDLLTPLRLSSAEFVRLRKEMGGAASGFFNESVKRVPLSEIAAIAGLATSTHTGESASMYLNCKLRLVMAALFNCFAIDSGSCNEDSTGSSELRFSSCIPPGSGAQDCVVLFSASFDAPREPCSTSALDATELCFKAHCNDVVVRNNLVAILKAR